MNRRVKRRLSHFLKIIHLLTLFTCMHALMYGLPHLILTCSSLLSKVNGNEMTSNEIKFEEIILPK